MELVTKYFPKIMQDNDVVFLSHLEGVIDSIDEFATMEITKTNFSYKFRLVASHPKYNNFLLNEILKFSNMFNLKLNLSKSIKTSSTIVFEITL